MHDKNKDVGILITTSAQAIKRALAAAFRKSGIDEITASHGYILWYLSDNNGRDIYQKDIEAQFSIGRSAVTSALNAMEKNGYIKRSSVESDARLKKITITEKGINTHITITNVLKNFEAELSRGLSEQDIKLFADTIGRIKSNAESLAAE